MSVYRDTEGSVTFSHPIGTPLTATITAGDGVLFTSDPIAPVAGKYTLDVPWTLTQYDAKLTITWQNADANFTRKQTFEVVTPLVNLDDLATIYTDENPLPGDLAELETTVRTIIQSYVGQSFGYSQGAQSYVGTGTGKLILKSRLDQMTGILGGWAMYPSDYVDPLGNTNLNGELNLDRAASILDGWTVLIQWPEYLNVRESPPLELVEFAPAQDGTIRVPRRYMKERDYGTTYTINGYWGYDSVPGDVQEAAMLLANDYITGDSSYRDRYLQMMKVQQDALQYHPGAFRGTGNVRADLLLGPYRRQLGMVIL